MKISYEEKKSLMIDADGIQHGLRLLMDGRNADSFVVSGIHSVDVLLLRSASLPARYSDRPAWHAGNRPGMNR